METSTARAIHDPAADFYIDALKKLHDSDPNWGPLYVAHRGDIQRDLAYARRDVRVELVERFAATRNPLVS